MTISATVVADSTCAVTGERLTSLLLEYPRFIHGEFMTHREISKNSSSSRAIPVVTMIDQIYRDTAVPIHWGKAQKGMQAREEHSAPIEWKNGFFTPQEAWLLARDSACEIATAFAQAGYHKQVANRLTEPFQRMRVLATANRWDNFFNLRLESFEGEYQAQPEIHQLAIEVYRALEASEPVELRAGEWHLPFYKHGYWKLGDSTRADVAVDISSSCSAQTSYRKLDDSEKKAREMRAKLREGGAVHASPFEHCATPIGERTITFENGKLRVQNEMGMGGITHVTMDGVPCSGNLRNFIQYRQLLPNHYCDKFVPR